MPVGVVETPADEKRWDKAKKIVKEQHGEMRWPLVMHIFKQMSKAEPFKVIEGGVKEEPENLSTDAKIERALESQGRKTTIPSEVHEHLHSWWQQNKDRVLTPKQKQQLQEIKEAKARRQSFHVVKSMNDINELQKSLILLKEAMQETLIKATEMKGKRGSRVVTWTPGRSYSEQEHTKMKSLTDEGYHPIEAAHISGIEKIGRDHKYAHPLSDKMLADVKNMAGRKLIDIEHQRGKTADPALNPQLHADAHLKELHSEKSTADDFSNALTEHIASGKLDNLNDFDRDMAISDFRDQWHKNNLAAKKQKALEIGDAHANIVSSNNSARERELYEQRKNIMMGGVALPEHIDFKTYSEQPEYEDIEEYSEPEDNNATHLSSDEEDNK